MTISSPSGGLKRPSQRTPDRHLFSVFYHGGEESLGPPSDDPLTQRLATQSLLFGCMIANVGAMGSARRGDRSLEDAHTRMEIERAKGCKKGGTCTSSAAYFLLLALFLLLGAFTARVRNMAESMNEKRFGAVMTSCVDDMK